MSNEIDVKVPDIGDFEDVDVIEILVAVGDTVAVEDPLITLESDKATMDIPAPAAGTVAAIKVTVGDKVSEGSIIAVISATETSAATTAEKAQSTPENVAVAAAREPAATPHAEPVEAATQSPPPHDPPPAGGLIEVAVPDIGDFENVEVIELLVHVGDQVAAEDPLLTLESDKATMDIPAPGPGRVEALLVQVGDRVSEGHLIARITASAVSSAGNAHPQTPAQRETADAPPAPPPGAENDEPMRSEIDSSAAASVRAYASPSVRKFARELGVPLERVSGSGRKNRITKPDVKAYVKAAITSTTRNDASGFSLPAVPAVDFAKFGELEISELNHIRRLTGQNLHRSWITAPHVTQFDEADITELEAFRKAKRAENEAAGIKLTLLAFLVKAVVAVLKRHPDFNASLSPDGASIIHKKYFHVGIAVNTDRGLVVPVLRDADRKGILQIAAELGDMSTKARERKLTPADMQGACFTISSLGGIGGTAFTPIINVPEVAILGVSQAATKPVFIDGGFVPRLILPFALSYDHRVIDGVAGAEFTRDLGTILEDIRNLLL